MERTDLQLAPGELVALAGPNGAGKSTLLALLAGVVEPSEGTVERRPGLRIGWAPQRPGHYARLSARENLVLFARLAGEPEPEAAAERLLDAWELPADTRAGELSVGNRQRLNLALAFVGSPEALLLDEPSAALDPRQRRRLWERIDDATVDGVGVAFATQSAEELERADRVLVLVDGVARFAGPPSELASSPAGAALA